MILKRSKNGELVLHALAREIRQGGSYTLDGQTFKVTRLGREFGNPKQVYGYLSGAERQSPAAADYSDLLYEDQCAGRVGL